MILLPDKGSAIDFGSVLLACIAVGVLAVTVKALHTLTHTQRWEDHGWPLHLAWCRLKAAGRVLIGRPAWLCGICPTPVALEHATCRRCTFALRDAFRRGEPFDQEAPDVP